MRATSQVLLLIVALAAACVPPATCFVSLPLARDGIRGVVGVGPERAAKWRTGVLALAKRHVFDALPADCDRDAAREVSAMHACMFVKWGQEIKWGGGPRAGLAGSRKVLKQYARIDRGYKNGGRIFARRTSHQIFRRCCVQCRRHPPSTSG